MMENNTEELKNYINELLQLIKSLIIAGNRFRYLGIVQDGYPDHVDGWDEASDKVYDVLNSQKWRDLTKQE